MNGRGWAGKVVDLVDLDKEGMGDVVSHSLELWQRQQRGDIFLAAGEIIVDAQHVIALGNQLLTQMRSQKPGAPGDEDPFSDRTHERFPTNGRGAARAGRPMLT